MSEAYHTGVVEHRHETIDRKDYHVKIEQNSKSINVEVSVHAATAEEASQQAIALFKKTKAELEV